MHTSCYLLFIKNTELMEKTNSHQFFSEDQLRWSFYVSSKLFFVCFSTWKHLLSSWLTMLRLSLKFVGIHIQLRRDGVSLFRFRSAVSLWALSSQSWGVSLLSSYTKVENNSFESNRSSLIRFKYFISYLELCLTHLFFPFEVWHTQINTLCKLCGRQLKTNLRLRYLRRLSAIFTLCMFHKKSPTFIQRACNEK